VSADERLVDRVGKLLAQAEGTDNEHEAAAFVERAQQLATAYAVDLELARRRQQERHARGTQEPVVQERVEVGPSGKRGNRHRVALFVAVARANDVQVDIARDSSWLLAYGHRSDLEVVERLWASLAVQMVAAADRRLARGEHLDERLPSLSWRLSFYDGFVSVVGDRLQAARDRAVAEAPVPTGEVSAALVLRAKSERVADFYAERSQARGSWKGPVDGRTRVSGSARRAGAADGARADLGQPGVRQRGQLGA
jgi:hypothetical protein